MKKMLVISLIMILLFMGTIITPIKAANPDLSSLKAIPDLITNKIIFLPSGETKLLKEELKNGTLGIVSFCNGKWIGFNIPGGNLYSTDIVITTDTPIEIMVTTPVALKLIKNKLFVYVSKVEVVSLKWNILSVPTTESAFAEKSWFSKFIPLQIVEAIPTGVETQTNYCCDPAVKKIVYGYKLYLSIWDPYNPPELSGDSRLYKCFMIEVMIPDYLKSSFEILIKNKDCIWIGLSGTNNLDYNYIYFWSH